jgi:non-specific protein-tyrosine kinase
VDQASPRLEFDRDRLLRAFRRWAGLVAVAALLAGATAFVLSQVVPKEYEATAQLYLAPAANPTVAFQDVTLGQMLATSYVELAKAEVVLRPAMEKVNWPGDLKSFRDRVNVAQLRSTSIISIAFRSTHPKLAADTAGAIASTFITQSRQLQASLQGSTVTVLDQQISAIQSEISSLDAQIASLRAELNTTPKPGASPRSQVEVQSQINLLDSSRQTKQQTLASVLKTRDDMRLAQARADTAVSLWQPATAPEEPVSPRPLLNTALGMLAGALVALLGVALITYLDDRLTDLEEIRRRLGAAPLGQVRLHEHPETTAGKLFLRDEPSSPEAEAIRGIRTNILFAGVDRRPRILLVTSALPGEGKSVLSANLALAFAESGTQVVLIDADLRRPSQHKLFRVSASSGLTTLLTEAAPPAHLQRFRVSPHLMVIPSGPLPPNPAELLASSRMSALLEHISTLAENGMVILDSSPALAVADPIALSTKVDGCIVVVDSSRTRVASTRRALASLERVHAHVIGIVLNKLTEREAAYYRYDGYYGVKPEASAETTTATHVDPRRT